MLRNHSDLPPQLLRRVLAPARQVWTWFASESRQPWDPDLNQIYFEGVMSRDEDRALAGPRWESPALGYEAGGLLFDPVLPLTWLM